MTPEQIDATQIRFWENVAQLVPVVTLAVVLEARAVAKRWTAATPPWNRWIEGVLWVAVLGALAVTEGVAMTSLRGDEVGENAVDFATATVVAAFTILTLIPAMELLLRGFAELTAWSLSRHPAAWFSVWAFQWTAMRHDRTTKRQVADLEAKLQALEEQAKERVDERAELGGRLHALEQRPGKTADQQKQISDLRRDFDAAQTHIDEAERHVDDFRQGLAQFKQRAGQFSAELGKAVASAPAAQRERIDRHYALLMASLLGDETRA